MKRNLGASATCARSRRDIRLSVEKCKAKSLYLLLFLEGRFRSENCYPFLRARTAKALPFFSFISLALFYHIMSHRVYIVSHRIISDTRHMLPRALSLIFKQVCKSQIYCMHECMTLSFSFSQFASNVTHL